MGKFLDDKAKKSIKKAVQDYEKKRIKALQDLGMTKKEYREEMTKIRQKAFGDNFEKFEKNLKIAKQNLEQHGFKVSEAKDATEAKGILKDIFSHSAPQSGTTKDADMKDTQGLRVVKSKSTLGKEIGVEEVLKEMGQKNFETDLGDFVVELMGEEDQHYVLPAIHLSSEEIAEKIKEVYDDEVKADPQKLTHYLCNEIRKKILVADVGITGANFFTQTGQVVLLENEGNISLVSRLPEKHIIVCGIDKLTESIEDATALCQTAAIFGTGQDCAQYTSIISGPSKTADIENELVEGAQGSKEVHIILVDNGRRDMLKNGFEEMLRCISCGACVNFCPIYHQMGKRYGGKFAGSKGIVMAANLGDASLEKAKESGSFSCTLCDACYLNCPMKISLMHYVRDIRGLQNEKDLQTGQNKEMIVKIKKHGNPFGKKRKGDVPDKLYCC